MVDVGKGFNRMAGIYDGLARLVYGRSIRRAQTHFLSSWPGDAKVLIVGGGTGWFLEEVLRTAAPREVDYLDISAKMLEKSRSRIERRLPGLAGRVRYLRHTIHELPPGKRYDVVVTHFYLDLFDGPELREEIRSLCRKLLPGGLWSLSDFTYVEKGIMSPVSRLLVGMMYAFFRTFAGIRGRKLEDYPALLTGAGLFREDEATFYGGMIRSGTYRKD